MDVSSPYLNRLTAPRAVYIDGIWNQEDAAKVKVYDGNIVVRVREGGSRCYVMTTSDSDGKMTVKNVSGPYKSR